MNAPDNTIAQNKKALFEYEILERFEAGIVLKGAEIKAVRAKRVDISSGYVKIKGDEAWLINMVLNGVAAEVASQTRKLLLHRFEISRMIGLSEQKGLTLIPLKMYFNHGKAKLEIGVAKGRKLHDKRELIKKRDINREQKQKVDL
jgi:SsrA-binding protein